jgi:polyhydroxyalkanoate synthesis repressor PhaR
VRAGRLHHHVHERFLGINVASNSFPRQFGDWDKWKRPQGVDGLGRGLDVCVHLFPGEIDELLLGVNEGLGGLARKHGQFGLLRFLCRPVYPLSPGGLGCLLGDDIQELLLGFDEVLHAFAGEIDQMLGLVSPTRPRRLDPSMGLLSGNLEKFFFHMNKSINTAPEKIGHSVGGRPITHPFLNAAHENFVLLLAEIQKYFLPFDKVFHSFSSNLAEDSGWGMVWVGELLPQSLHDVCVLPHGKIQEHPLRREEALNSLLGPTRKHGNERRLSGMSRLSDCRHKWPPIAALQHQVNYRATNALCQGDNMFIVHGNIGEDRSRNREVTIKKYGNRRLYDTAASRYVNLDDIARLIREGKEVKVVDAKTGSDLTRVVLTQIITEDAKDKPTGLPLELLRQLIIASDEVRQEFVMWYLKSAFDTYQKVQDAVQNRLSDVQSALLSPLETMKRFLGTPGNPGQLSNATREVEALRQRVAELESRLVDRKTVRKRRKKSARVRS